MARNGRLFPDDKTWGSIDDKKALYRMFLEEFHPDKWGRAFSPGDVPQVSIDRISQTINCTFEERWPKPQPPVLVATPDTIASESDVEEAAYEEECRS